MKTINFVLALLLTGLSGTVPTQAWGDTIAEKLPSGITVTADYRQGSNGKPAILVLHGFLTTHGFNTVQVIVNELADSGHTVLAPTLSLGITSRNTSLPCDAIHTHTMDNDLAEVDFWVHWLVNRGENNIILVGHSSGSLQLAIYAATNPHPSVRKVIASSLINVQQYGTTDIIDKESSEARRLAQQKSPPLREYNIVYCNNFTATPQSYLSYIRWSREAVLDTVNKRKVPIFAIMGGSDNRFGQDWVDALRQTGIEVKVIPGANHFFDAATEFDLLDEVKNCIQAKSKR